MMEYHRICGECGHDTVALIERVADEPKQCESCESVHFIKTTFCAPGAQRGPRKLVSPYSRDRDLDSMAVKPSQVEEAKAYDRKLGVPTEYFPDERGVVARPRMRSRTHEKKYLKAHGLFNRDDYS